MYVELTNRESHVLEGSVRALATAAWEFTPAGEFRFRLPPGETTRHQLAVALPAFSSPGTYDLGLRVRIGERDLGTLRTRLVKPMDWLVVGPFEHPAPGQALPPERGVNLDGTYDGVRGTVEWRTIPDVAFDATGGVELDLVYSDAGNAACACTFTAFDTGIATPIRWSADGIDRLFLNGVEVGLDVPANLIPGRNSLLARVCARDGIWRLRLALLGEDGLAVRDLDNDLEQLLEGFDAVRRGRATPSGADHLVTLEYHNPNAASVDVLGAFNAWVPLALERSGGGRWTRNLLLPGGRYAYKLRVDGQLLPDPASPRTEADGFGGLNSILIVR